MKKNLIYSALVLLMGFVIYSCTKSDSSKLEHEGDQEVVSKKDLINSELSKIKVIEGFAFDGEISANENVCVKELEKVNCESDIETRTFIFPEGTLDYPDCDFYITFEILDCGDEIHMVYQGLGTQTYNQPECDQFYTDSENPDTAQQVFDKLYRDLTKKAMAKLSFENLGYIPFCNDISNPTYHIYRSYCYHICKIKIRRTKDNPEGTYYSDTKCDDGGCCVSKSKVCLNLETFKLDLVELGLESTGICEVPIFGGPCPGKGVPVTLCTPNCTSLEEAE